MQTGRTVDLMYLGRGGIIAHPGGPAAGVQAIRQAWEVTVADILFSTYGRSHVELVQSQDEFGRGRP